MFAKYLLPILAIALAGCTATQSKVDLASAGPAPASDGVRCSNQVLQVDTSFPAGAFENCSISENNRITVSIAPEDSPPINCSAWYALRINSQTTQKVELDLTYSACGHRYWPKYSHDGLIWTYFDQSKVKITEYAGLARANVSLKTDGRPIFIAAQEIVVPSTYDAWLEGHSAHPDVSQYLLGKSAEGRDIPAMDIAAPANTSRKTVVLVGRQHPPEVTGALAMFTFMDTILADTDLARAYRARFKTVAVPMLNPDGVVHGYWRHNTGSVDLNRDWGPFTQPETRLMCDLIEGIDASSDQELTFFLDFHSTQKDVLYTLSKDLVTNPAGFIDAWIEDYQRRLPGYEVVEQPGHNAERPVSKAWIYERFGIPAVTYEIGDETDRALIKRVAKAAAESMMATLLADDAKAE